MPPRAGWWAGGRAGTWSSSPLGTRWETKLNWRRGRWVFTHPPLSLAASPPGGVNCASLQVSRPHAPGSRSQRRPWVRETQGLGWEAEGRCAVGGALAAAAESWSQLISPQCLALRQHLGRVNGPPGVLTLLLMTSVGNKTNLNG